MPWLAIHPSALGVIERMAITPDSALENLARMVQVIAGDPKLCAWFQKLADTSFVGRRNEIYGMVHRMSAEGQDSDLVASFQLLADSRIFEAACVALKERCARAT
jgi:hypothetical protein